MIDPTYPPPRKKDRARNLPTAATAVGEPERVTVHEYVGADKRDDPRYGHLRPEWHLMWRCSETGAVRSYGCEGRATPDAPRDPLEAPGTETVQ